ncbi:hypothetical protein PMIN03_012737 [Paraphaeosphaeria minitans]
MLFHHPATAARPAERHCRLKSCRRSLSRPARTSLLVHRFPALLWLLVALLSWTSLLGSATAASVLPHGDRHDRSTSARLSEPLEDTLVPVWKGPLLLVDSREPPFVAPFMPPVDHGDATKTTSAPPSKRSIQTDSSASGDFQIPTAFDSALSNNFTTNCATFFKTMLQSETVTSCHPFSLILRTSNALFKASKSFIRITQTLEATCAANSTQCTVGMNHLATQLLTDDACKVDYDNNNPQVIQAYNGLVSYEPMYLASCLKDDEGDYCYANAVTNTTSEGVDAIPFYLPLGVPMTSGARTTCNSCLLDEMAIFSQFAANSTQPVSMTYSSAADAISMYCGTAFVNVTAAPLKGAASTSTVAFTPTISLFIMFFFVLSQ